MLSTSILRKSLCIVLSFALLLVQSGCYAPKIFGGDKAKPKTEAVEEESIPVQMKEGYTVRLYYLDEKKKEQIVEGDIKRLADKYLTIDRTDISDKYPIVVTDGIPKIVPRELHVAYEQIQKIEILDENKVTVGTFLLSVIVLAIGAALYLLWLIASSGALTPAF